MSLILTRMQNFRAISDLDKYMNRASRYGALDVFAKQTESPTGIVSEELLATAAVSQGNTLEVPVFDQKAMTVGNTRPAIVADDENDSTLDPITFATYEFSFTMVPAQYSNNEMSEQRDFDQKMKRGITALLNDLDTACITVLETDKTQVVADPLVYSFAANILTASQANRLRIIADLTPIFGANDYFMGRHIIGNAGIQSLFLESQENAEFNATNLAFQWLDKEVSFTNRLANGVDRDATGFFVNEDSIGIVHRVDRDARQMHVSASGHKFEQVMVPGVPFPMGLYYYETVGDYSGIAGAATADLTRTWKQHWSFSVDVAFITAYNTDPATIAAPVLKFDIADT